MAAFDAIYFNPAFGAENGILEGDGNGYLDMAATLGSTLASPNQVPEEGVKDVAEAAEDIVAFEVPGRATTSAYPCMAKAVVFAAFFGV